MVASGAIAAQFRQVVMGKVFALNSAADPDQSKPANFARKLGTIMAAASVMHSH